MRPSVLAALAISFTAFAAEPAPSYEKVADKAAIRIHAFEGSDVRLLDGPFLKAFDDNTKFLLSIEPDRLLHRFLAYSGLRPKGEVYGGWESEGLSGHSLGHYLSACALAYSTSRDPRLLDRVNYIVDELARVQEARGDGYIGAIPNQDALIRDIEKGDFFNVRQNYINDFWAPWYTIHKIFAGLLDAHRCTGNEKALRLADRFGRWAVRTTRSLDDAAWQKMLYAEFGGMSEALAELYARTGEKEFLDLSRRFYHKEVLDPLAAGEDKLEGFHANCQIPKVIGAARDYELTGDAAMRRISTFFWESVVRSHTYANGGNSEGEYFGPPGKLSRRLTGSTSETCNTYNMLKLTRHLITWEPKAEYADYAERALFNHILASIEPGTGMKCYYVPLAGEPKEYSTPNDSFWCCVGTGWENPPRYTDAIYFHDADSLYVNLFVASRVEWREKGIAITQETRFPEEESTRLKIEGPGGRFALRIRNPRWAASPVTLRLNGEPVALSGDSSPYATIDRKWKNGDLVEVRLPMGIRVEATPDDPDKIALFFGPILLAADLGAEGKPAGPIPVLVGEDRSLASHIQPAAGEGPLTFRTSGIARPADVRFIPYYKSHHAYGPVYFDRISEAEWTRREEERKTTEARALDRLSAGDAPSGISHALDTSGATVEMALGRPAWNLQKERYAYVRFELDPGAVRKGLQLSLLAWSGSDGSFEVSANGIRIAKGDVKREKPIGLRELTYALPDESIPQTGAIRIWITTQSDKPGPSILGAVLRRSR
ncbi:MAG: glycoside hydrolase family 127 protein [Acidobacteria bacterium]|nr:glycoside hydrolase family 127 protein [Acidobacteriota bacterium]